MKEAEALLRWVPAIKEARSGAQDLLNILSVFELAAFFTQLERDGEAKALFRPALVIRDVRLFGTGDVLVSYAINMNEVPISLTRLERVGDAKALCRLPLAIKDVRLFGTEDVHESHVLHALAG